MPTRQSAPVMMDMVGPHDLLALLKKAQTCRFVELVTTTEAYRLMPVEVVATIDAADFTLGDGPSPSSASVHDGVDELPSGVVTILDSSSSSETPSASASRGDSAASTSQSQEEEEDQDEDSSARAAIAGLSAGVGLLFAVAALF